jgi:putative OPT family oligopeptide transporter
LTSAPGAGTPQTPENHHPAHDEVAPELPPLPEGATPEEKDRHWFEHVYRGDRMPQLTIRAVVMGGVLGMLMSISNLYTTLKVGWSFGVAITSCVLSFVIWNAIRALMAGRPRPMGILENNCMQSTASAAGYSTGSTIGTAFGALLLLDPAHRHQPWLTVASFTLATGAMGVFLAIPMKRQMINQEQLPFPSGIAAAATLRSLYSRSGEALQKAYALIAALCGGVVVGVLNTAEDQFVALGRFFAWMRARAFDIHLPELVPAAGFRPIGGKPAVAFGFEPSVLLIGAGMIVGLRVSLSMLASAALLYYVVAPWLHGIDLASGSVAGYVPSIPLVGGGALVHPVRWSLWGGTSLMVCASLASLALQWRTIGRSFSLLRRPASGRAGDLEARMAAIEVPNRWMVAGLIPITIAMLLVQMLAFQIAWWAGLIAIAMSFVLAMVASRATGETDTTPIGAMGKITQFTYAVLAPANTTVNLMTAGITAGAAGSSADLLTDLKSGYLLGANPRQQFLAQFIGLFFGVVAVVPLWYVLVPNQAALEAFNSPATGMWYAVAQALSNGVHIIPVTARWAIVAGGLLGIALTLVEALVPKRIRPFTPSAMGLGLAFIVPFQNSLSFFIGAVIAEVWTRVAKQSAERFIVPIASGAVAGESIVAAGIAIKGAASGIASG